MRPFILILLLSALFYSSCTPGSKEGVIEFTGGEMLIGMDQTGRITALETPGGRNLLHPDSIAYLIHMRFDNGIMAPVSMEYMPEEGMLYFYFAGDHEVKVTVEQKKEYIRFGLFNIRGEVKPDLLVWGPFFTAIQETIGETVGVVRDEDFAIGIQSLNPKTLGGYPWRDNDVMPEIDYFSQGDYSDLRKGGVGQTLYRIEAARPLPGGSALHAYCRNRFFERSIDNWGYTNYVAEPYPDNGLIGSAIALFGCPPENVLNTISAIELAEGLPHPAIDGEWSKTAREASSSYMILDFGRADIGKALAYVEKSGLKYLYHSGPFETWGHFVLNKEYFPEGRQSLRECVDIAAQKGIAIGVHTLSNFITTNDAYVTPVPDRRLAEVGHSRILEAIGEEDGSIIVEDPSRFNQFTNNYLKAARICDEIIRYRRSPA